MNAFGGVDAVVHAVAGTLPHGLPSGVPIEQVDRLCRRNTRAMVLLNREAARHLRDGGAIVNMTTSLVGRPMPFHTACTAGPAAIDALTRVLAQELVHRGITVNAVCLDVDGPCEPNQIADIIVYLLSEAGHSLTGRVIYVHQSR